ncbi:MAG TPA: lactate racemase domain-containing protein, partial [Pyrinomonadaceae bacterium]
MTHTDVTSAENAGAEHSRRTRERQTVFLSYGDEQLPFRFDPDQFTVLAPHEGEAARLSDDEIQAVLDAPIASPTLEEIVSSHDRVVIVVPDATRVAGVARIAPLLVERLNAHGLSDGQISVLVGGGIHRAPT